MKEQVYMDKEYIILGEISENQNISQRQLAEKTGLSLGSINLLLKKMIKEGLIKMETIPANRVAYMLTPKGMVEKVNKTYKYIKYHYKAIEETKEKVKIVIKELLEENKIIYILLSQDEISHIVRTAIEELDTKEGIVMIDNIQEMDDKGMLLTLKNSDHRKYRGLFDNIIDLGESL